MQLPIHARPSDEVGRLATLTLASGIEDPDNPLSNLQVSSPASIFLTSSSGTDVDIVWDHLIATVVKLCSLHHHNLPAGTEIRLQRNATNSWGAPTIDVPITIGAYPQTGLPLPIGIDLTGEDGYDETGLRYTRLHIPSLAQLVGLGSALLWGAKRTDWDPVLVPNRFAEQQPTTRFRTTRGAIRGYSFGQRFRSKPFLMRHDEASWATFLALFREVSNITPFLWWPDPTHSSDAWLSVFSADTIVEERPAEGVDDSDNAIGIHDVTGTIEELACGEAIPTELVT